MQTSRALTPSCDTSAAHRLLFAARPLSGFGDRFGASVPTALSAAGLVLWNRDFTALVGMSVCIAHFTLSLGCRKISKARGQARARMK